MALVDSFETSDAVDTSRYGSGVSPLTEYVRKICTQPTELWLVSTCMSAVNGDDPVEVLSLEVEEASAANGFVRYVEAVSAEPLEYWLCPGCEMVFPDISETSLGDVAAENANRTWPESSDVATSASCIHQIWCKPDSFWVINQLGACRISDETAGLNLLSVGTRFCIANIDAVSSDVLPQQGSANSCDLWLLSSDAVRSDQAQVVGNVNDPSVSFEFQAPTAGEDDAVDFSNHFASLSSKPVGYWLNSGSQNLSVFGSDMQSEDKTILCWATDCCLSKFSVWPLEDKWLFKSSTTPEI